MSTTQFKRMQYNHQNVGTKREIRFCLVGNFLSSSAKPGRNVNYAREHTRLLCATTSSCVQYETRYQRHHHVIFEELYANNPSAVLLYIACRPQLKTIATTQIVDKLWCKFLAAYTQCLVSSILSMTFVFLSVSDTLTGAENELAFEDFSHRYTKASRYQK